MARLHSRNKGKSGSKRPPRIKKPEWVTYSPEEVEQLILQFGKKGETASSIGLKLRDQYGIPLVKAITGKKIHEILTEHDITTPLPEDMTALIKKALNIRKHLEDNRKDLESKKGLQRTESKIYRLLKYYKAQGILEPDFKYKPKEVALLIR
ncbi:MAG TPA: 30S ribosomal protein S15 [Candidatus Lokiarchaeia archaeon]|nr:30S ribosomal protein S15 [Candidatus Lokiarchaeia archaeon]